MRKIFLLPFLICLAVSAFAQEFPSLQTKLVNDLANILSSQEQAALEQKLVAYDDTTSTQIAVITIKSLEEYTYNPIEEYAVRWAHEIGIGQGNKDNGILILLAMKERKVTIQTGYGLEGAMPDAVTGEIIDKIITPNFKNESYYQGLDEATDAIFSYTRGEYQGTARDQDEDFPWVPLIFIIIILFFFFKGMRKNRQYYEDFSGKGHKGRSAAPWIWGGMGGLGGGRGGGGFGGGGGGGFGGFGGGGFGGGGASGGW